MATEVPEQENIHIARLEWQREQCRKILGATEAPPDHEIYSEGASIILLSHRSRGSDEFDSILTKNPHEAFPVKAFNSVARKVVAELKSTYHFSTESLSADDIPGLIELDPNEIVEWVSSTWIEPHLINLFLCTVDGEPASVIVTAHGDRGVLELIRGPFDSIGDAKRSFGDVPEKWTDFESKGGHNV